MTTVDFATSIKNYTIKQAQECVALLNKHMDALQTATYKEAIIKKVKDAILAVDADAKFVFDVLLYARSPRGCNDVDKITDEHIVCTLQIDDMKVLQFDITFDNYDFCWIINTNFMGNIYYSDAECEPPMFVPNSDYRSYVPNGKGYMINRVLCNCLEQEIDGFKFIENIDLEPDDKTLSFAGKAKAVFDKVLGANHKLFAKGIKGGFGIGGWSGLMPSDNRLMKVYVHDDHFVNGIKTVYADKIVLSGIHKNCEFGKEREYIFYINFPHKDKIVEIVNGLLEAYEAKFRLV
jgi:hypothetical protein